jgi:hypothetical protein
MTLTYTPHATTLPTGRARIPAGLQHRIYQRWLMWEPQAVMRARQKYSTSLFAEADVKACRLRHTVAINQCVRANLRWSTITRQNLDDPFMSDEHRQRRITEAVERRRRGIASVVTRKRRSTSADPS